VDLGSHLGQAGEMIGPKVLGKSVIRQRSHRAPLEGGGQ
jgi:hypothetical protein